MKAAIYHGKGDVRIEETSHPMLKDRQVIVQVEWCGICGSDLHEFLAGPTTIPKKGSPHLLTGCTLPVVLGHEFCGRIKDIANPNSSRLTIGQAVVVNPTLSCGKCVRCAAGATNACTSWGFLGLSGNGGGLAELVAVDEKKCHPLAEGVALENAALIEPLAVARHAVKSVALADLEWNSVLVIGAGPIGAAVIHNLRLLNVNQIFVTEPTKVRREWVKYLAHQVVDPSESKVGDVCRDLTDGKGVDVVFDCAGVMPGLKDGINSLKHGGKYVNVAGWETALTIPFGQFMIKEVTIKGSMSYTDEDFREVVMDFNAGRFRGIEKMVTARVLLDDVVDKGIKELISNKDSQVKIVITPRKELLES